MSNRVEKVIVIGATGLVGRCVLQQLEQLAECQQVTAVVRHYDPHLAELKKVKQLLSADLLQLSAEDVDGYSHAISCLGTTIAKAGSQMAFYQVDYKINAHFAALFKGSNTHYLLISAMGADPKSRFFYNRVKGELEHSVKNLNLFRASILRPSLLLGQRQEQRRLEQLGQKLYTQLAVLLPKQFRYKPVSATQVAAALVKAAQIQSEKFEIYDNLFIQQAHQLINEESSE